MVLGLVAPVQAAGNYQAQCNYGLPWSELETPSFSIIYTTSNTAIAVSIRDNHGEELEQAISGFSRAFDEDLVTPISIRIYPTVNDYYCLNALTPAIDPLATHAHIGSREIVLIGENIISNMNQWEAQMLNAFRHELVILFAEQITEGNAPEGFLEGLGGYAENPNEVFESRYQASGLGEEPDLTWQALWDQRPASNDVSANLQATSTAAYLIDVYGWESFVQFLKSLETADGYREAMNEVYGKNMGALQRHWRQYFPAYIGGRWRANVFHSFDLTVFEQMLDGGAYEDALSGLREAIPLLEAFGDQEGLAKARELEAKAQMGVEASALAGQARQALLEGDYQTAFNYAIQSLDLYSELKDDSRLEEITAYLDMAQRVLKLRSDLEELQEGGSAVDPTAPRRITSIGQQLAELGDSIGVSLVNAALVQVSAIQRLVVFWVTVGMAALVVLLLVSRLWALRRRTPPEADLL